MSQIPGYDMNNLAALTKVNHFVAIAAPTPISDHAESILKSANREKFQNFVGPFSDYFSAYLVLYWTKTLENLHNNSIAVH